MLKEVLQREAPSLYIMLYARARIRNLSIDAMSDDEIIDFVRREMGEHNAELLKRIVSCYN